jgi:hypothetical protein
MRIGIRIILGSQICKKSKFSGLRCSKWSNGGAGALKMEAWMIKIEPSGVCNLDEEQDLDPGPH